MTLIVAKKTTGAIFVISDTSSFEIGSHRHNPSEFTAKIIPYRACVVAFAGVIEPAHEKLAFRNIEHPNSEDVLRRCRELSSRYKDQLDFIHIDYKSLTMTRIANGRCEVQKDQTWLGSLKGFSKFQDNRLNENPFESTETGNSGFWMVQKPENTSEIFWNEYSVSLKAFNETLRYFNLGIGGFAVPFIVNTSAAFFGYYVDVSAGFNQQEILFDQWQTVELNFNRPEFGSFARSFTGSSSGFRMTIPQVPKEMEWHSPFLMKETPPISPFFNQ